MKATVHADGGRYGFYFSFGAGAVDKGSTVEVGDYVYKKAITWSRSPNDGVGSWEAHQSAGYIDAYLWQTILNAQTPNYTVSVKGQRKRKGQPGPPGGNGQDVWEDWETDAKQFAVQLDEPSEGDIRCIGETVTINAKAVFDPGVVSLTHLKILVDGQEKKSVTTSTVSYDWDTTGLQSGNHTITVSGEGTLGGEAVDDSKSIMVTLLKLEKLQYRIGDTGDFVDAPIPPQRLYAPINQNIEFQVVKQPGAGTPWPDGKPMWSSTGDGITGASGTGEQKTVSINASGNYSVTVTCGESKHVDIVVPFLSIESDRDAICGGGWSAAHGYQYLKKDPDGTTHGYVDREKPDPHVTTVQVTAKDGNGVPIPDLPVAVTWDMPGDAPAENQAKTTDANGKVSVDATSGDELSKDTDDDTGAVLFDTPVPVKATCLGVEATKNLDVTAPDVQWQYKNDAGSYVPWSGETWALYSEERDDIPLRVVLQYDGLPVTGHSISWGFDKIYDKAGNEVLPSDPEYSTYGHMSGGISTTTTDGSATATYTLGYNFGGIDFRIDDESVNTFDVTSEHQEAVYTPAASFRFVSLNSSPLKFRLAAGSPGALKKKRTIKKSPRKGVYAYIFETPAWNADGTPSESTPWSYPAPSGEENNELLPETRLMLKDALGSEGAKANWRGQDFLIQQADWWISQVIGDDHESYGYHYADMQWNNNLYGAALDIVLVNTPIGKKYAANDPLPQFKSYVRALRIKGFVAWHRWAGETTTTSENEIHCIDPILPYIKKQLAYGTYINSRGVVTDGQILSFTKNGTGSPHYKTDFQIYENEINAVKARAAKQVTLYLTKYGTATAAPPPSY
jgi:hypothetical protein